MMTNFTQGMQEVPFNRQWELALIIVSAFAFAGLVFYPQISENIISMWFQRSIVDIENTVLIGFVFKAVGFFFLIGLFFKMLNALNYIISGKPMVNVRTGFSTKKESNDDSFDDFEEIDDNKISE
jgi:fucose 4-O-acetylase-like acetyltransferase